MRTALGILSIITIGVAAYFFLSEPSRLSISNAALVFNSVEKTEKIRLGFVGDMIFDREVESEIAKNGGSYSFPFQKITDQLSRYDFLFGNLEGPVSDIGANRGSKYSFRMNPQTIPALSGVGFKAVSVANNHIGDWGQGALEDTFARLEAVNILHVGGGSNATDAYAPQYSTVKGLRIAFVGESEFGKGYTEATDKRAGIAVIDIPRLQAAISQARQNADIVVASFHFGEEYHPQPNTFQRSVAEAAIDAGADLVVGHHPHVLEPLEAYGHGYIVYSMGNFIFDQRFSTSTMSSGILDIVVTDKKITSIKILPVHINENLQPELLENP